MKDSSDSESYIQNQEKYNKVSVVAFWCAWISLFLGIILGIAGLCQIKKKNEKGKCLAIFGITVGSLKLIYLVYILLFTYPSVNIDLARKTACSHVDGNGNYKTVIDDEELLDGKIICTNYVCEVTYNGKKYSYKCER